MDRRTLITGAIASLMAVAEAEAASGFYRGTAWHVPGWRVRHFHPAEVASRGNNQVWVSKSMMTALDRVRDDIRRPLHILSGYRDPAWNRRVGGARLSRHIHGDAIDIDLSGFSLHARYVLAWYLIDKGFTSFGSYGDRPGMLHADRRPRAAIWHHGGCRQPRWLSQALQEWHWRPVSGSPYR